MFANRMRSINPTTGAYVGPGDLVSGAIGWWGLRAYNLASCGTNCAIVRRDSDNTTATIKTLSTGAFDLASASTFKGSANLFIQQLYDQTGSSNHVSQSYAAFQPQLFLSGGPSSGLPYIAFIGTNDNSLSINNVTLSQPFSLSAVSKPSGSSESPVFGTNQSVGVYFASGLIVFTAGGDIIATQAIGWNDIQSIANDAGSGSFILSTGTTTTGTAGTNALYGATLSFGTDGINNATSSNFEWGMWPSAFSAGQAANIESNQRTYCGF